MGRKWVAVSAAICSMWIATLFISIFAPELKSVTAGGDVTSLPVAGIVAASVAFVATIVLGAIGFTGRSDAGLIEQERHEREELELRVRALEEQPGPRDATPPGAPRRLIHR